MEKFIKKVLILMVIYLLGVIGIIFINMKINSSEIANVLEEFVLNNEKEYTVQHLKEVENLYILLKNEHYPPSKIKELLKKYIRFENKMAMYRYIFVYLILNEKGGKKFAKMIINPNAKNLVGKYVDSDYKDIKGHKFRADMVKILNTKKRGFVSYYYKDPQSGKITKKITYVIYLPDIKWLIASGVYMSRINSITEKYKSYIIKSFFKTLGAIFIFLSIIGIVIFYLHNLFLKEFRREIEKEKSILKLVPLVDEEIMSFKFDSPYLYKILSLMNVREFAVFDKDKNRLYGNAGWSDENIEYKNYFFVFDNITEENLSVLNHIASIFYMAINKQKYEHSLKEKIKKQILEIKQKDKELFIKEKTSALGEVVGNISHQWKQPLNAISNIANNLLLDLELGDIDKENMKKSLNDIQKITQNMASIIDVFKNLYKMNAQKGVLSLKEVFENVFVIFNYEGITIEKNIQNCVFEGYLNELEQVILAILTNAKEEFQRKNISGGVIKIDAKCYDNLIKIEIEDNAGGIDKEALKKIFEDGYSTKNSSGLGLAFSKKIIEKSFKGKINVTNTAAGAKFTITCSPPPPHKLKESG